MGFSDVWNRTLVYFGIAEEDDDVEEVVPGDDPRRVAQVNVLEVGVPEQVVPRVRGRGATPEAEDAAVALRQQLVRARGQDVVHEAALALTLETGIAHYWSRSRKRLWRKGEESGHVQRIVELRLDCDADALLLKVEQAGGIACHTGRHSCFFPRLERDGWKTVEPVLKHPEDIYE
jgi:phosphoribosyl-AMP cyclohydrolase